MRNNGHIPGKTDGTDILTVLVVAPDVTLLKLMEMALKLEFACEVLACDNGRSALEMAKIGTPDLVVMHAHLLDLDTLELADRLHDLTGFESVPMLLTHMPFASGNTTLRPYLTVLTLPFELEAFYAAIRTCLGRT